MGRFFAFASLVVLAAISTLTVLARPLDDTATEYRKAQKQQKDGNFQFAADRYREIISDVDAPGDIVANSLQNLQQCLRRLNAESEIDAELARAVEIHGSDYRVLARAATTLSNAIHAGTVSDQRFTRVYRGRGGNRGTQIITLEQDRLQAIQWLRQAIMVAKKDGLEDASDRVAGLRIELSRLFLMGRNGRMAWRLQSATDLSAKANYINFEAQSSFAATYAPVDSNDKPLFHQLPDSFDDATSDGQRYRWLLAAAARSDKHAAVAKLAWAQFLHSQFSVNTLQQYGWSMRPAAGTPDEDGVFSVHTLAENETVARLASGIKRFDLPDDLNSIRIYKEISAMGDDGSSRTAAWALVQTFLNRRQYPRAATLIEAYSKRFPSDNPTARRSTLDGIRLPRLHFDPAKPQLAGNPVKLSLLFRNATSVGFTARRVDIEKLVTDTKRHLRRANRSNGIQNFGGKRGQSIPNLNTPSSIFRDLEMRDYLAAEPPIIWNAKLAPRPNHWDRRVELTTPLEEPGLYVIDAVADGENPGPERERRIRTLVWVQDTVIVRKPMADKVLIQLADARSGDAIKGSDVEFFGWGYEQSGNRNRIETQNFAKRSDRNGQVIADLKQGYQWLTIARTRDGRLALLNFEGFYNRGKQRESYLQPKAYGVSDRPVYRPGDTVKTKFWVAYAVYGNESAPPMAGAKVAIEVTDSQGNRVIQKQLVTDEYGGCELEFELSKSSSLGRYDFRLSKKGRNGRPVSFDTSLAIRVEEYRKPEFEVNILAPKKPVALGETVNARIQAKYFFGAPVTDAEVKIKVERTTFNDHYFPMGQYDWCYGPGYWWFAEDYTWYPGWRGWCGCVAPTPWWWGGSRNEPPELVLEQTLRLDATGEATVSIDTATAKSMFGDSEDHRYTISCEVRDASRRTITATGEVVAAREAFKVFSWVDRGFYRVGDPINANFHARMLDGTNVSATGTLDLLRITYGEKGNDDVEPVERIVGSYDAATDADGRFSQRLVAKEAGQYRLRLRLRGEADHEVEGGYIFTVRGDGISGDDFRYSGLELTPDRREYQPGETVQLQIAADYADATVAVFIRPAGGVYGKPQMIRLKSKSAVIQIPVTKADQPNFFVEAFTIYEGKVHTKVREIVVPPEDRVLEVELVSDKTEYLPGEEAEVKLRVTSPDGKPVKSSCVIAAYDRSLELIAPDVLPTDIREFFWKWRRNHQSQHRDNMQISTGPIAIGGETILDVPRDFWADSCR